MRIANQMVYHEIRGHLNRLTDEMMKANTVVSSMKKINNLSDDPVGLVAVLDLRSSLSNINQMERNISMGKAWLDMGESVLTQVEDILLETKTTCVQMATATVGVRERNNAAVIVDGYLRQIQSLANTQVDGRYIFAGTMTDVAPFAFDDQNSPTQVIYSGNDMPFSVTIGKDLNIEVGRDGEDIFGEDNINWADPDDGSENIFKTLIDLKMHLQNNDVTGIGNALDKLDNHMSTIRDTVSDIGAKGTRLEVKSEILADLNLTYTERKSKIEDADLGEAMMQLSATELAYQAALASSSKVMSLSLLDYL